MSALPTLFLVFLLHFYLKRVFFQPLEKVLHQRDQATEGARKAAEESLTLAGRKAAEYEVALRDARSAIYKEQEQLRRSLRDDQSAAVADARVRAGAMVAAARTQLAADVAAARVTLEAESEALADQIADRVLRRGAHA